MGKMIVVCLVVRIYKVVGLFCKGYLVEMDWEGLVVGYVG